LWTIEFWNDKWLIQGVSENRGYFFKIEL
jgi:hypothetical protein